MAEKKSKSNTENKSKSTELNVGGVEAALEKKQKKSSTKKKVLVGVCIFIAVLLLIVGVLVIAADVYLDNMLGLISYDPGDEQWVEGPPQSDDIEYEESISIAPAPTPEIEEPYENIEGWFDGNEIAADYENEVINILLLGADTLDGNYARSDTMMLMSINPVKKRVVLTSFMRDSYIEIPGYGYNRLNASHSTGGPKLTIETIEYNFGIDIDYYAKVDFTSFKKAVDAINGIDLVVNDVNYNYFYDWEGISGLSREEAINGTHSVHLNGEQALLYTRTRKGHRVDNSDFGRTLHQRDFISQFVNSCKGASLDELHGLLEAVLPYVVTDIPQDTLKSYIMDVLTYLSYDMSDARVPCDGSWSDLVLWNGAQVLNVNVPANEQYVKAKIYG